jgi:hypothetical protein
MPWSSTDENVQRICEIYVLEMEYSFPVSLCVSLCFPVRSAFKCPSRSDVLIFSVWVSDFVVTMQFYRLVMLSDIFGPCLI